MKTTIKILVLLLFTFNIANSQNKELDKRNGFKTIKLGSHYDDFDGLDIVKSDNKIKQTIWKPSNEKLKYIFNQEIDFFTLKFDKETNKLIEIDLVILIKESYNDPKVLKIYNGIIAKLASVLGKPDKFKESQSMFAWFGYKVALISSLKSEQLEYDDDANLIALTSITISFASIEDVKEEELKDGF